MAGKLKDRCPALKEIKIDYQKYTDAGPHDPSSSGSRLFCPDSIALIRDPCDQRECVNGGFDLTEEMLDMVRSRQSERSGKKTCQGWQDEERIGQFHCLHEFEYTAKAVYSE